MTLYRFPDGNLRNITDAELMEILRGELKAASRETVRTDRRYELPPVPNERDFAAEKPQPKAAPRPRINIEQPGEGLPL